LKYERETIQSDSMAGSDSTGGSDHWSYNRVDIFAVVRNNPWDLFCINHYCSLDALPKGMRKWLQLSV